MSFKIVDFLKSSQAFNLQELVRFSINRAVTVYSTSRYAGIDQGKASQTSLDDTDRELSEVFIFTLESMHADQECIALSDLTQLVEHVCYRVIQQSHLHIHKQGQKTSCDDQLVQSIYKLFAVVLNIQENAECHPLKTKIQKDCLVGIHNYSEEQRVLVNLSTIDHCDERASHYDVIFSIQNSLGVLDHLLNSLKVPDSNTECVSHSWLEECFLSLVDVLEFSEATICSHVSGILLPKLLKSSRFRVQERLTLIWKRLLFMHKSHGDGTTRLTSNVYIALCGLSEFYIPISSDSLVSSSSWMLSSDDFWRVLQSGLLHLDPLARKQACFLMKRAIEMTSMENKKLESTASLALSEVSETSSDMASRNGITSGDGVPLFWWSSDVQEKLLAMWGDFFLLYETLDEIQVHVVTPVMPRLRSLLHSASTNQSGVKPILHTSWLTILFTRCFVHETKTVLQWGLLQYLHLDINACPMMQQGGVEFFLNTVLPVLSDDNLYGGQAVTSLGSMPPVAMALKEFINKCVGTLGTCQTEVFLRKFLLAVSHQSWSPISLTFIFETLASLPEYNAWGAAELQLLREMQYSCISMLSVSYRSVVQCLMIQSVLKLLDKDNTTLHQLSKLLGIFSRNDFLIRGSPLWNQVCQWFGANRDRQLFGSNGDMVATLRSEVTNLMTFDPSVSNASVDLGDIAEPCRVSCLILLLADSHHERMKRHSPSHSSFLQMILEPLICVLGSINSHIYLPIIKTDTSLQLVLSILRHLKPSRDESVDDFSDDVRKELSILLSPCLEEIFNFIARRLLSAELAQTSDISRVSLYIAVLESICSFVERSLGVPGCIAGVIRNGRTRLLECCQLLLIQSIECRERDATMSCFQTFVSCSLLLWILQSSSATDSLVLPWDKLLPLVTVEADTVAIKAEYSRAGGDTARMRKISSLLLCTRWQCISVLLRRDHAGSLSFPGAQSHEMILAACLRDLSLVKGPDAVPILQCATLLVNKVIAESTPLCLDVIHAAWSSLQDEWRSKAQKFWILYSAVIELIFQHCFMVSEDTKTYDAIEKIISSILTLGEGKPMIISIFIKHLCHQWLDQMRNEPRMTATLQAVSNHRTRLLEVCVMGTRVSKDTRLQQDISVFLITLDQLQSVRKELSISMEQRSGYRRVILLNFLLTVARTKTPECCQLITDFAQGLVQKFLEMKTTTRRGHTMNSQLHRENFRLWQTLLVLAPYIQKEYASQLLDNVLTSAVKEKQSSVRHLMVWVAIRVLLCNPNLQEMVWDQVQQLRDTSESNICPLLILIAHLGIVQPDLKHKESFYKRAFPILLPRALVQTSSIRHTGQLCVKKLWQDCTRDGLQGVLESFPALRACMEYLHDNNPGVYSRQKLDSNFFLFKVDLCQDYTIQTIFHILPFLSSLAGDEFLEADSFEKDCPSLWRNAADSHPVLALHNPPGSQLQEQYLLAESKKGQTGGIPLDQISAESSNKESNVQKKVIPWQSMIKPGFDDLRSEGYDRSSGGSLVLVASLIDKAPNLGGLCRTSQIFGVSTFVVNSLRVTEDNIFKSVSVTAEKWLPMVEVPVSGLATYLQSMRHQGYTLVGVEQTARSKCLTQYNFPQRTLLLLGHERTGIPVELIQLLDVCVEIPQQGVIRSLNVHVSGALLIWEYTRQRLLAQMTTE